jgi:antitoxin MazE
MQSQINKWGNSAAVRIPANILSDSGLSVHSNINIEVKDGRIIIEPAERTRKSLKLPFSEASLLQKLNAHNAHADEVAAPLAKELGE